VKSIQADMVKRELAKTTVTPGPGYYTTNILKSYQYSPSKPFRHGNGDASNGYSFGKHDRGVLLPTTTKENVAANSITSTTVAT
jgi:hypothetical protein